MDATARCSCGLLPCICVTAADDDALDVDAKPASRLRSLVAANATTQCMSCMFLPCICPAEDDDALVDMDAAVSPSGADAFPAHGDTPEAPPPEETDALGRVRLLAADGRDVWVAREIKRHLRPHQVQGVRFLYENAVANQGCILADYMGLGKTLQVIATIYSYMTDPLVASPVAEENEQAVAVAGADGGSSTPADAREPLTAMVLCPAICIPNWQSEFKKWLGPEALARIPVFAFDATAGKGSAASRVRVLQKWKRAGGVLLMGYEMYRSLLNPTLGAASLERDANIQVCTRVSTSTMEVTNAASTKLQKSAREFYRLLCAPGADLVVLDEGHRLKDPTSLLCQSVAKIQSKRRLVLTGYPVQNSLSEYWCMVNFARDNFLGSYDAFRSRYERPIVEGNHERSKELIHKLKGVVLRRGQSLLKKQLPPKSEWILYCKLSPLQQQLYNDFLNFYGESSTGKATADLLTAYAALLQVMNHPDIIHQKLTPDGSEILDDEENDLSPGAGTAEDEETGWGWESEEKMLERRQQAAEQLRKRRQKALDRQKSYEWARATILGEDGTGSASGSRRRKLPRSVEPTAGQIAEHAEYQTMVLENSGKMAVLMRIIEESFAIDDKVVVFSQSVPTLKVISDFLRASKFNPCRQTAPEAAKPKTKPTANRRKTLPARRDPAGILRKKSAEGTSSKSGGSGSGMSNAHNEWFLQIDGSTPGAKRMEYIQAFSSPTSAVKLLLVSTRAGAEGINLHAANRLVLFDVSWNPSNDHQSMCRSHRIGQAKAVHVYRLVSTGTMERMIYEQQMKKVDLSTNVVDDKQQQQQQQQSTAGPSAANFTEATTALTGFLHPPSESTKALVLDETLIQDDEVLVKCVASSSHWLADVVPAHDIEEEDDEDEDLETASDP